MGNYEKAAVSIIAAKDQLGFANENQK